MKHAEIRIGTSGWQYRHWVQRFYPARTSGASMLRHYFTLFDTVELNNTFYRIPQVSSLRSWRESTGDNFCFALKASRFITHNKKLKDCESAIELLLSRAGELGGKLGPILFQLPPHWGLNLARPEDFLRLLPEVHRYAFEFRNASWDTTQTFRLLHRYNAAYCIFHLAGYLSPIEITADWTYIRLHGPGGKYQGSYGKRELQDWANCIADWSIRLKSVYIYFDNDQMAFAPHNALELKRLVELRLTSQASAPMHPARAA
jgi:uncharacterized protein YecE (DUF72 family)